MFFRRIHKFENGNFCSGDAGESDSEGGAGEGGSDTGSDGDSGSDNGNDYGDDGDAPSGSYGNTGDTSGDDNGGYNDDGSVNVTGGFGQSTNVTTEADPAHESAQYAYEQGRGPNPNINSRFSDITFYATPAYDIEDILFGEFPDAPPGFTIGYAPPGSYGERGENFIEDNSGALKGALQGAGKGGLFGALLGGVIGFGKDMFFAPDREADKTEGLFSDARKAVNEFDEAVDRTVGPEVSKGIDIASWVATGAVAFGPLGALVGGVLGWLAQSDDNTTHFSVTASKTQTPGPVLVVDNTDNNSGSTWPPIGIGK
jgi:hypothetical protein